MRQQHTPTGWYPDPTGRHETRYFNGQWTEHVCTCGVNSTDPLPAWPAQPGSAAIAAQPAAAGSQAWQSGPSAPPSVQSGPSSSRGSRWLGLVIAGGVIAAVGVGLAVWLTGGSTGNGFCADARALNEKYPSSGAVAADIRSDPTAATALSSRLDTLAAESPSPQDAADLRYLARFVRDAANGNYAAVQTELSQAGAAGRRFDAYVTTECSTNGSGR